MAGKGFNQGRLAGGRGGAGGHGGAVDQPRIDPKASWVKGLGRLLASIGRRVPQTHGRAAVSNRLLLGVALAFGLASSPPLARCWPAAGLLLSGSDLSLAWVDLT